MGRLAPGKVAVGGSDGATAGGFTRLDVPQMISDKKRLGRVATQLMAGESDGFRMGFSVRNMIGRYNRASRRHKPHFVH